ncbi:hypothetical protein GYA13_01550 [Candidatus Kuenenbacteria bacterium]|nr:hypothetical protein [Candidatus Kuenenbacteria bacterium]
MKNPIIRAIYLYLFALVGLGMLVIGASMIINLGLKAWVFTQADQQDKYNSQPIPVYLSSDMKTAQEIKVCSDKCELTAEQKEQVNSWLAEYKKWEEQEKNSDQNIWVVRNRQRQAATALSLILIGLPLWLFHWSVIKKDNKKEDK